MAQAIIVASVEPLLFSGEARSLRAEIELLNPGATRLALHHFDLWIGPPDAPIVQLRTRVAVFLAPGERRLIPFVVDPGTWLNAGEYAGAIEVDGAQYQARFVVAATRQTEVSPSQLVVKGAPGTTVSGQVLTVRNRGNQLIKLAIPKQMPLGLAPVSTRLLPWLPTIRVIGPAPSIVGSVGPYATVHASNRPASVKPGESVLVRVDLSLPAELDPGQTWFGQLRVGDTAVEVQILVGSPSN